MPLPFDPRRLSYLNQTGTYAPKQPVLLECWEPWCPHCVQEIPHIASLSQRYKNVYFVGYSSDQPGKIRAMMGQHPQLRRYNLASSDPSLDRVKSEFGVRGVPHALLFGPDGGLLYDGHPSEAALEKALAEADKAFKPSTQAEWVGKSRRL